TVTDANNCTAVANVIVGNIPGGVASILTYTDVTCYGLCNGSATAVMGGGTPPYTYQWSNGANTQTINNLCAGLYTVTITDQIGCTSTATVDIKQPLPLNLSFTVQDIVCFSQCNGQISVIVSGGTPSYSYLWSNNANTSSISNLCSGVYSVTVTDANGCTRSGTRTISDVPPIQISGTTTNANCGQSNGSINISVSQAVPPLTFNWSNGATTEDLNNIPSGIYYVTVTDSKGCTATATYTITDIGAPTANITVYQNVLCYNSCNGALNVNVTGGTSPYTFIWNNGQTTQIATNLCAGTYHVTVTDAAGCSTINTIVLNQPPALQVVQINKTNPSCNGSCNGSVTAIVTGGTPPYSYNWSGGNPFGGTTPNQQSTSGLCNGNLYVTVVDANNCTATAMTFISEPTPMTLIPFSTPVTCAGYNNGTASVLVQGGTPPYTYQWSANTGGQITQTAINLGPGVYSCTVTDANGCTQSMNVTVTSPQPLQFSSVSYTNLPCYMSNNGTITVNVMGGTPPYSFNWTNSNGTFSSTSQNLSNLPAHTYFLTVTDANGCSINTTVIINQPPPLQLSLIKTNETCYQYCNGIIQANVSGGQMPYSYIWSNGATTNVNDSLCPGLYSVTVVDNNGCSITGNATIIGPPLLQISIVDIVPATCGQANGEATIAFQGGSAGYIIQWSTGGTTVHESNMPAGNHTVTVIDTNGCVATLNVPVPNLNGPQITDIIEIPVTCAGAMNGAAIVKYQESTPPAPPYTVIWSNGLYGDTITGLSGGLYFVTVQDNNGCIAVGSAVIHEPTNFVSIVSSTTHNHCYGECIGTASVIAAGGTQPYTYNWLGLGYTTPNVTNLCAGTYTVVCVDANGCTSTNSVTITQPSQLSITGTINNVKCNGGNDGSIYVYVNGGTPSYQFLWQPPIMGSTSVASNLTAGSYTVLVTDSWNCTATATFTVYEPNPLIVMASSLPETCNNNNGSAYIQNISGGIPPYYVTWSPTNLHSDTIHNLTSGVYTLIINDANNCTAIQQVIVEEITPPYYISFTSQNLTCYNSFDGSLTVNVQGGSEPYNYLWSNGQSTQTAINLSAGYYTVTVTDNNGCTIAGGSMITQPNPVVVITYGTDSICAGNNYVNIGATAIGGTPPYTYLWLTPVPNPTAQNQSVSPDSTTTFLVNAYDANGCMSENPGSIMIYVYSPLSVQIPYDIIHLCKGNSFSIPVDVQGGKPPYIYIWNSGTGNPNTVSPFQTTTYYVTVTDQCNSYPVTDSITIYVELPPSIIRPPLVQKGCAPLNAYFDVIVDPSSYPVSYLWNFGDPSSGALNTSTDSVGIHTYNLPGIYPVTLTLTSSFGCSITLNYPNLAQVYAYPSVDFTYEPTENLNPINGDVWFHAITDHNNQVIWLFGDGSSAIGKFDVLHSFTQPGIYPVTLIAKNNEGCTDTVTYYIKINEIFTLWAPNAITPGLYTGNAYFYPRGLGIDSTDYYLAIFDRWGNIIFETREMPPATNMSPIEVATKLATTPTWKPGGWNGGFNNDINNLVPPGSYIWYVKVREKDTGYIHEKRGIVTVIR
ncbi:MAG: PKD domain-containing protein, partial [Bacteroidales bacterium]|nr:PKD domain-containing protein [Bacteroidales bacterium]